MIGAFFLETAVPGGFNAFLRAWERHIGDGFPRPTNSPATIGSRVTVRATRVADVAITDIDGASAVQTALTPGGMGDLVRLHVVRRGAWTVDGPPEYGEHTVAAGQFLLRHAGRPSRFQTAPHTTAKIVVLPAATLTPLIGGRGVIGPADSPEVRLLVAHANMVYDTMPDLSPTGVQAARNTLIELAKAVAMRRFDDAEPRLAPALAQAAKNLADSRLVEPELSPAMLARELNVSLRTLHRAFAATGESVSGYVRDRRLEEARLALTARSDRLSVSELAAYWQFADRSHFIRAFKKRYGQTPTQYARSPRPAES
ncbi:helix-turn-helix domain-containing protein [Kitasatospora sp. NPDC101155]|uniref:helix-turn-helix domain-containing protein n=1 Tax=Kitasatospora sp. NPDC101155 TaxID=3364097 RepID=UPI0037F26B85